MLRRLSLVVALVLFGLAAWLAWRPFVDRPVLADRDDTSATAAHLAASPTVPRAFYGRRLEPRDRVLHGAGQSDRASFDRYRAATGTDPALFMTYVDLRDDLPAYFAQLAGDLAHFDEPGGQTWPQIGLALNHGRAASHYEAETATGADDAAIAQLCTGVRALGRPVYLRVGYEFNGPWNGYVAAPYVAAFRRIAAALHSCTPNVAVVWNWSADAERDAEAAGYRSDTFAARLQGFYPGDDAVDWWALNLFTPPGITAPATQTFLQRAAQSQHPVMIAESSPRGLGTTAPGARDAWFAPYFGLLRATPGIQAFCYINWNWAGYPQWADWGDSRLEAAPDLLRWYRGQLATLPLQNAAAPRQPARTQRPVTRRLQ